MIQAALTTGCYRAGSKNNQTAPSPEEILFWSKSNTGFVFEECALTAEDGRSLEYYQNLTSSLKKYGVKFIGYSTLLQADINQTGTPVFYNIAEKKPMPGYEDFFLYNPDGSVYLQSGIFPILNVTSERFKSHFIQSVADYMNRAGFGGILIDTGYSEDNLRSRKTIDLSQVVSNTGAPITNWNASYIDFLRDLNAAIDKNGDKLLFVNVDGSDTAFVEGLLPSVDGVMLEDPIGRLDTEFASRAPAIAPIFDRAAALNKYVLVVVNININCPNPGALSCFNEYLSGGSLESKQTDLDNYYLAGYLNLLRNKKTVFIYYTPTPNGPQFNSSSFFKEWDLKLGDPAEPSTEIAPGVFLRKFQNAFVYFNNSNNDYQISGVTDLYTTDGSIINNAVIPAKSGRIFVTRQIYNNWARSTPSSN